MKKTFGNYWGELNIITTRLQYQRDLIQFKAGKVIVQTNVLPIIHQQEGVVDVSIKERIVVIPFDVSFVTDEDLIASDPSRYKKVNSDIKQKLQEDIYRYAFMELLVHYYRLEYKPQSENSIFKSSSPEKVMRATNSYFEDINYEESVNEWFHEYYRVVILPSGGMQYNPEKKLAVKDLYDNYCGSSSPHKKISFIFFTQIITDIVGRRDGRNSEFSRGVYINAGKHFIQGYYYYYYY